MENFDKIELSFACDSMHFVPNYPARPGKQLVSPSSDEHGLESFAFDKQVVKWGSMPVNISVGGEPSIDGKFSLA